MLFLVCFAASTSFARGWSELAFGCVCCHGHIRCFSWAGEIRERPLKSSVPDLWHWQNWCTKEQAIRTTVDIPASLYRKLKEQAAAQGRSIRELILLRVTLIEGKRPRSKRVKFPLIASHGPKVDLTNERIYEHIEFP
jgi:hypothetical protein